MLRDIACALATAIGVSATRCRRCGHPMVAWPTNHVEPGGNRYLVRGKPRSTFDVPGSGQRDVTTLARV
jgi:hypothetical protein